MHFMGCFNFEDPCSMKYPPVVSTLQEWLDGKFGIQGIDAVSWAFYVLSLLQRERTDEPEAFYQFPCSKIVDDQGVSYWPQNSWSNWGFDYSENSLAAKCVSAPVQGYEIDHLGNDLSPSLRNIKSEGGDKVSRGCLCDRQCFSLPVNSQAERCREVFSVRGHPNERGKGIASVAECENTLWANESACVGFYKHKLEGGGLEEKNNSSFMAEKMIHEKGDDLWMADSTETGNEKHFFLHDDKLLLGKKDIGCFFSWNTTDDQKLSPNAKRSFGQGKCSEEMYDVWEPGIFCKQVKSTATASLPHVGAGVKYGIKEESENVEVDSNLARLIAKFDHSIEAIWDLGSTHSLPCEETEGQQNLSWSCHSFISPPQDDAVKMDLNSLENNLESSSEENSFIHSGTNIITSIWSNQPSLSNSAHQNDSGLKDIGRGVSDYDNCVNDDHSDLCCKLKVLLTSDEILQNEFNLFGWNSGTSDSQIEASKNTKENSVQEVPEGCPDILWNKIQSFPSLFSNINFQEQFCHMNNLQEDNCENQRDENSCMISCSPCSVSHFKSSCQDNTQDEADSGKRNFSTLNHNREDSSFTEVLPRHTGEKKVSQEAKNNSHSNQKNAHSTTGQSSDANKNNSDNAGKEEEEDLLTSARTHFRPIQQENPEPHNNPTCCYADGTTFVISSNFAEVPFKRSESGTLFLECDDVPGTPKKYMEYKDKRTGDQSKCAHSISKDILGNKGAFIPKFCVRQVEKCCQTDESDESSDELNSKRVKRDCVEKERKSNLFFSEDEIAKSVADYLDEDDCKFSSNEIGCKNNFIDEKMDDTSTQNEKNDSVSKSLEAEMLSWNRAGCKCNNNFMYSSKSDSLRAFGAGFLSEKGGLWEPDSATRLCQSRYSIWSCSPGPQMEPCPVCETLTQDKTVQYSQLREELSEDGEQLLSDLSSLQPLQLSASWLDDTLEQSGWGTEPNLLTRG